ncbi:Cytoplasmic tRNA 2-thiolation protein 2 [Saxophila tyrrhenica]|uniref:Cytoplasmic tRNA 2-thiolation protein 2 n=1 Tax=Saxophila tyrrhenica TaxID=1690608 RepID=A0AAV9P487_9PEZI|nr:Cytoplasmic tRNA 2-thiolation protein 2 [Saxophila tyrrhenica]
MPGRRPIVPKDDSLCRRCQTNEPTITVRTEPLCNECFCRYVSTKVVKRMESFRVKYSDPGKERVLSLPLSFGACSTTLLHILSEHMKGQVERTGRSGYQLHIVHVDDGSGPTSKALLEKVKERFPEHTYSILPVSEVLSLDGVSPLLQPPLSSDANGDTSSQTEPSVLDLLATLPSATSRADTHRILLRRLITNFATNHNCESILWAHSTTRLAELTLAETAKGRGASLPWLVTDTASPSGPQNFYPMRELLTKEIIAFSSLTSPPLDDLILKAATKPAVSTKNTSIDDLMRQYFESVERDYPSIVANVVRTTGKLKAPGVGAEEERCELCEMPLGGAAPERSRLCYGCIRTLPGVRG